MKSLKDFNYLLSLDRRYTKTESEIFRSNQVAAKESFPFNVLGFHVNPADRWEERTCKTKRPSLSFDDWQSHALTFAL